MGFRVWWGDCFDFQVLSAGDRISGFAKKHDRILDIVLIHWAVEFPLFL
jgi:hypothetical protein